MASTRNSYHFDYVKAYGKDIGSADVVFPLDDVESIEINGHRQRGYCGHVGETGKSSDGLYYRVHLSDYTFWVDPSDYHELMDFLHDRQKAAIEVVEQHRIERDEYNQRHAQQLLAGVHADPITDDIYWCYIQGSPDADLQKKFAKLTSAIAKKCDEHGGRLYKTAAKSAKYAIMADYRYYTDDNFDYRRASGYKVVTLEQAVNYMGLQKLWDDSVIQARLNEHAKVLARPCQTGGTSITLTLPDISQTIADKTRDTVSASAKKERVKYPPRKPVAYTPPTEKPMASDAAPAKKERVKYPPRRPVAYTPPTEKPMKSDAAPAKKDRVQYSPHKPEDYTPPSANPVAKSIPPMPTPQPQPNKSGAAYALLKVLGIILVALGLFLSIASVIGGFIFTAIGCLILQKRARIIEAATGQTVTNPFRRRWQIVVSVAFVLLAAAGALTPDPVSKISLNGLVSTQLEVPEATSISYKYEPADASTDNIICESSDTAVATVEISSIKNGVVNCLVTPLSAGDVTISCKSGSAEAPVLEMSVTDPTAEEEAAAERKATEEAAAEQTAAEQTATQTTGRTVYVTPTGKRYHYSASCAGENATEATLEQAQNMGLTPCKNCASG